MGENKPLFSVLMEHLNRLFFKSKSKNPKIKVLFAYHRGCNEPYLVSCLKYLVSKNMINLKTAYLTNYLKLDQDVYDILIYQTFPGEENKIFFKPFIPLIKKTDEKFFKFKKYKLLFDGHASGSRDGYSRFNDPTIPRIKNAPHKDFLKKFNVVCSTTYPIPLLCDKNFTKNIDISFCVSLYSNPIRLKILNILRDYKGTYSKVLSDTKIMSPKKYQKHLRYVWISVNAPGWGEGCFRHNETLNAKSLMFSHESINNIKLLPNAELIEGQDYISFNLDNITDKLDFLLKDKGHIQTISENGYKKFIEGYSIKKTAMTLFEHLSQNVNKLDMSYKRKTL